MTYALGIDIGGTFTDVLLTSERGHSFRAKVLTTPQDLVQGCLDGVAKVMALAGATGSDVIRVVHATTQATNTLTERRLPPVALLITEGFRDLVSVSGTRGGARDTFDLLWDPWEPPTRRNLTYEVPERIGSGGEIVRPLDETGVRRIAERIRGDRVAAVAVCLLHSYAAPQHELRVREILEDELGTEVYVATSAEVWPEYMEVQRCYATLFTAYIGPVMRSYLKNLERGLTMLGITPELQVMQSSGGAMSVRRTMARPLLSVESGPTAGALAAAHVSKLGDHPRLIAFDMGGTTAKASLIESGKPNRRNEFEIGGRVAGGGEDSGGVVLRIPSIDLAEVGAGGGSIAWIDQGGMLQVGPRSAAAEPGPACYGLGGIEPTVTDANVILGYLSPDYFLGGSMPLDITAAVQSVGKLGADLGLSVRDTASAIHDIANQTMANAVRLVTLARGADPAEYTLIAFGGAGPMHAARVAESVGVGEVLVPRLPGVFSTVGLLASDMELEDVATLWLPIEAVSAELLEGKFAQLERPMFEELQRSGYGAGDIDSERSVDLRYKSQGFDLSVPVEPGYGSNRIAEEFAKRYQAEYGVQRDGVPIVARACRVRVRAPGARIQWEGLTDSSPTASQSEKGTRSAYFAEFDDFRLTPVYERECLGSETTVSGPAMIEEPESTLIVPPKWTARFDTLGNMRIRHETT